MDTYTTTIAVASIVTSGITISIGVIGPALERRAVGRNGAKFTGTAT